MNIADLFVSQIKASLCALNQHLGRLRYALRKHLSSLIKLISDHRVRAVSWARYVLLLRVVVVMAVEVRLLLVNRTVEEWLPLTERLVVQVVKVLADSEDVLRLLCYDVLALTVGRVEYGRELLSHWNSLGSRLFLCTRVLLIHFWATVARAVVVCE